MTLPFHFRLFARSDHPSKISRRERRTRAAARKRFVHSLRVERLEERALLAGVISISDATATEGSSAMKFVDTFISPSSGGLQGPRGIDYGPDGNLYINSEYIPSNPTQTAGVNRYNAATGQFIDRFATLPSSIGAKDVEFGPDGNLYVPTAQSHSVYRFNGTTGEFMDVFIPSGSGGLNTARNLIFGPDGNGDNYPDAYVTSAGTDNVLRYDGVTGAFIDAFVTAGSGGLNDPTALVFGPDGDLFVASGAHSDFYNSILRYDGTTGAFETVFVAAGSAGLTLAPTAGVIFGPDVTSDGISDLYVSNGEVDEILIYNGSNGEFVKKFVTPGLGGLNDPKGLLFDNDGNLLVVNNGDHSVLRFGAASQAVFTISLSEPSATLVTVNFSTANQTALADSDYTAISGTITFAPGQTKRTVFVQTVDNTMGELTETFTLNLSNAVGATIADSTGVATILDNDPFTKFYVVNDASPDRTYEYDTTGSAIENYALSSGNTAPRGAASSVSGTTVWVVDANKVVYVYDTNGALLGSWTAGGFNPQSQLEGIATNGTDIWLVDGKSDKVYRYTGAASRLSGSQNAASSFSLNSGNKDPKDIVTDGSSLWVVNNSTMDKVFKYTTSGSLLGSWTITTSGATSPTGITQDPTNVSHIWIVDNGTDRVYQYNNAAGLTSGSKSADSNFALATGNTNPQGIADPPPAHSELAQVPVAVVSHDDSPAARISGQVFFASLGSHEGDRRADSQPVFSASPNVDVIMRGGRNVMDTRHAAVNRPHTLGENTRRSTEPRSDGAELDILGLDFDESIDLLAHDCLGVHPSLRGR